jgi:hypothetical protein
VQFKQKGGVDLHLDTIATEYTVSWELSDSTTQGWIAREGSGLAIRRPPGSVALDIRLHLSHKTNAEVIRSDWVKVPTCQVPSAPVIVSLPDPPAVDVMRLNTAITGACDLNCGGFRVMVEGYFENVGTRTVRCEQIRWFLTYGQTTAANTGDHWVQLNPGQKTTLKASLTASYKSFPFGVSSRKGQCWYV